MHINLNIENKLNYPIPSEEEIKQAIEKLLKEKQLEGQFEVDVKFVDKNEIQEFNKKYRQLDKPTDVLSFPIYDKIPTDIKTPILLGDIIICPEMAQVGMIALVKHSTLHLLGYHHKED